MVLNSNSKVHSNKISTRKCVIVAAEESIHCTDFGQHTIHSGVHIACVCVFTDRALHAQLSKVLSLIHILLGIKFRELVHESYVLISVTDEEHSHLVLKLLA